MSLSRVDEQVRPILGYVVSGAAGVGVYALVLYALDSLGIWPMLGFTVSYVVAVTCQFMMNRYWSFRALERPIHHQALEYAGITLLNYLLMIAVELFGMRVLRLNPLESFALSVPINLPVGYLANRYFTFRRAARG